jgi:hypothetical protein
MQYNNITGTFALIIIGILVFIIPGILTVWNVCNCLSEKPKLEKLIANHTIFYGAILYFLLFNLSFEGAGDWYEQIASDRYHNTISSEYSSVYIVVILGFIGYFILLNKSADKLPPLLSAISISFLILMNLFQLTFAMHILKNVHSIECLLYVYHFNILLLSARVIHRHMKEQAEIFRERIAENNEHKKLSFIINKINSLSKYSIFVFIVFFFVIALLELIFVLLGQGLDAPIKAFTDTADWTFSKQIPPPPVVHDGHYLCTVAAGGHKKVVKPIRLGTRRNETIVVNRQLCIANAFEELIQEKTPRFHKKIRKFYDTHGYPLSRKITSPARADIIYIIMKPLEWAFLIFLYAFDKRPEQRIARQYAYKGAEKI